MVRSIEADFHGLAAKGVGPDLVLPPDSYFSRYVNAINEVSEITLDESNRPVVTVSPFTGRFVLAFALAAVGLVLLAAYAVRAFERRSGPLRDSGESREDVLSAYEDVSIKKRLRLVVLAICASALVIVSGLGIFTMMGIRSESEDALIYATQDGLTHATADKAAMAKARMAHYAEYAAVFAGLSDDPGALSATVGQVMGGRLSETNVFRTYSGYEDGRVAVHNEKKPHAPLPPDFDCRKSEWYMQCKKTRKVVFTDIYEDIFGDGKMVTCAAPIYDGAGNFVGVFGVDVLVSDLYDELTSLDMGDNAYAFLLNSRGNVVTANGAELTLEEAEGLDEEASMRLRSSDGAAFERNGIYYTGARVENTGWTVCIHAPFSRWCSPSSS